MDKKYYFIGVGGIGMSALACYLRAQGIEVAGSDLSEKSSAKLKSIGVSFSLGHDPSRISQEMTVVYSTDTRENIELTVARQLGCRCIHRSELLQEILQGNRALLVSGSHGKTTTTALLGWIVEQLAEDPTVFVGGVLCGWESNVRVGASSWVIAEADESDQSFLCYEPTAAILTNIDREHLSYYNNDFSKLIVACEEFASHVENPEWLIWCGDDPILRSSMHRGQSYGFSADCDWRAVELNQRGWELTFTAEWRGGSLPMRLPMIGNHNALNALAVLALLTTLGFDPQRIAEACTTFPGVHRRQERLQTNPFLTVVDDYGHHPTEIAATLRAVRAACSERRLIALIQPHRYSRVAQCQGLWHSMRGIADIILITDLYTAEEKAHGPGVDGIIDELQPERESFQIVQKISREQLIQQMARLVRPHDVVVVFGAGDSDKISAQLAALWLKNAPRPWRIALLFGGESAEHAISCLSVQHIARGLSQAHYELCPFLIDPDGRWSIVNLLEIGSYSAKDEERAITADRPLEIFFDASQSPRISQEVIERLQQCEVVFPVLHGPMGEDGTVQGFCEMLGLPYVGCDWRSAALSMDKYRAKQLLINSGVPTLPGMAISASEWDRQRKASIDRVSENIGYPLFVKPVHLGSSIGIHKVESREALEAACSEAFLFDDLLLFEKAVIAREIEFAVLGNGSPEVVGVGEILANGQVYDFAAKYGVGGMKTTSVPDLSSELLARGKELAAAAYQAIGCIGLCRIDFLLEENRMWWCNELNPMPGFTEISLYPKMAERGGYSIHRLVDRLVVLALQSANRQRLLHEQTLAAVRRYEQQLPIATAAKK